MKKIFWTVLFVALAATFVNDVGRYAKARYDVSKIATETVQNVSNSRDQSRDQNARDAAQYAASRGATVYAYDQDDSKVYAWLQMPVEGTWVLGPGMALLAGEPIKTPYLVHLDESAFFQ